MKLPPHLMIENLRMVLGELLDNCDYTAGNCRSNEMVGAVIPAATLQRARKAANDARPDTSMISPPPK